MNIILSGAVGRMGHQVAEQAKIAGLSIVCGIDNRSHLSDFSFPVYPSFSEVKEKGDVIIDFSSASALPETLEYALAHSTPVLLAATGYTENDLQLIHDASKKIAIFKSANMSIGIQALKVLAKKTAMMLEGFDIEIVERHHNQKADAPSGTALLLLDAVKNDDSEAMFGRHGTSCKRKENEIGVHAIRGGTVAGEHEVGFYGQHEVITITHSAQDRSVFAAGAIRAAAFLCNQKPGLYDMSDMIQF